MFRNNDLVITSIAGIGNHVEQRLVDVEHHELQPGQVRLQILRRGVQSLVERNGVVVQPLHALVASSAEQRYRRRQAPRRRHARHSDPPRPQIVQVLVGI